jgi:hypothetical protein
MNTTKVIVTVKHDNGRAKISVWAESIENAIQQVVNAEKCPPAAIVSAKVVPHTISDIKYKVKNAPYFFTRETMRFFNQTLRSFSVTRHGDDCFRISAPMTDSRGNHVGYTVRIYNAFSREFIRE